jgi:hypothetical protein
MYIEQSPVSLKLFYPGMKFYDKEGNLMAKDEISLTEAGFNHMSLPLGFTVCP